MESQQHLYPVKTLTWTDLYSAKFAMLAPFKLILMDQQILYVEKIVRFAPKRRLVVFGTWQDRSVAAKLFIKPYNAKLKIEKDSEGVKLLQQRKILTPQIYLKTTCADKKIHVLLLERIINANPLEKLWRDKKNVTDLLSKLYLLLHEIANQHRLGVMQKDMNLKNYLFTDKNIYSIDGAGIELFPKEVPKKACTTNLASFFSYLGIEFKEHIECLYHYYANLRGWSLTHNDIIKLLHAVHKKSQLRWKRTEKKMCSESSHYACIDHHENRGMFNRDYARPEFISFIKNPDETFEHLNPIDNTISVKKVRLDGRLFVVKRFNKNHFSRMTIKLARTPAFNSWRHANKLNSFGILTEKPAAFLAKKYFFSYSHSYYISEYVADANIKLIDHKEGESLSFFLRRITLILKHLFKIGKMLRSKIFKINKPIYVKNIKINH